MLGFALDVRLSGSIALCALLAACGGGAPPAKDSLPTEKAADQGAANDAFVFDRAELESSVQSAIDTSVNACDDFYQYACGGWFKSTELPADKPIYTRSFSVIADRNQALLRELLDGAVKDSGGDATLAKLGAYYGACLNEDAQEARGLDPVKPMLAMVDGLADVAAVPALAGELHGVSVDVYFDGAIWPDAKQPDLNILHLMQGGLSLPDREYYLTEKPDGKDLLVKFEAHVAKMFELAGADPAQAKADAAKVVAFETALAKGHWEVAKLRDSVATYNPTDGVPGLQKSASAIVWQPFFDKMGLAPKLLNLATPSALDASAKLIAATDLDTHKAYLRWHILSKYAGQLTKAMDAENFAFFGQTLSGQKQQQPRWKRCVSRTEGAMGELLGEAFVKRAFAGESKQIALDMIVGIEKSFEAGLTDLAWMDDVTRERAVEKARAITNKIGYPDKLRDYSGLVVGDDAFANEVASTKFNVAFALAKVDKPVDPSEWFMTAHQVNAYYNPAANEIAFPAGILQPPFFHKDFPKAFNYGGMGMVMGHEITHGFDDEGRRYTKDGRLEDWWEAPVVERFEKAAECIGEQYAKYEVAPGVNVNPELTMGENIADLGGLKQAYRAYRDYVAANGEEPTLAGLTGDQQFFVGFAQGWCTIATPEIEKVRAATDSHSPPRFRINGPVSHFPEFAKAFECAEGTPMRPAEVCEVW